MQGVGVQFYVVGQEGLTWKDSREHRQGDVRPRGCVYLGRAPRAAGTTGSEAGDGRVPGAPEDQQGGLGGWGGVRGAQEPVQGLWL